MPRRDSAVKNKRDSSSQSIQSIGAVDIHFHGAFGIDLMSATPAQMDELSRKLWKQGVAAFCPTTLSAPKPVLVEAVERIGRWIQRRSAPGALPLGIHLEGPFIHPGACGAHPPGTIRSLSFKELDGLWEASQETLKILTVAPERLSSTERRKLVLWAKARKVVLSLGHSKATEDQAAEAFDQGFTSVTHAWNALGFHHRSPGPMGAALGRDNVFLELILDQVHVSPTLIRWTRALHAEDRVCFVSDCVPAAGTRSGQYAFGPLKVQFQDGACRLPNGALAGGGLLLTDALGRWVKSEVESQGSDPRKTLRESIPCLTSVPLKNLGISPGILANRRVRWTVTPSGQVSVFPIDSPLPSK